MINLHGIVQNTSQRCPVFQCLAFLPLKHVVYFFRFAMLGGFQGPGCWRRWCRIERRFEKETSSGGNTETLNGVSVWVSHWPQFSSIRVNATMKTENHETRQDAAWNLHETDVSEKIHIFGNRWRNRAVEHPIAHAIHRFIEPGLKSRQQCSVCVSNQTRKWNWRSVWKVNVDLKCVVTIRFPFICHSCHSWFLDLSLKPYRKWNQDFKNFLWPGMATTSLVHALSHHANRKLQMRIGLSRPCRAKKAANS